MNEQTDAEKLKHAARIAAKGVLGIKKKEKVLIITNPVHDASEISKALYEAVLGCGGAPVLIYQPVKSQFDYAEESVIGAMEAEPDVVISISVKKLGKDRKAILKPYKSRGVSYDSTLHYLLHGKKTIRSFWSPGITKDIFIRTIPLDYTRLKKECLRVKEHLDGAKAIHIFNKKGTDIKFNIEKRKALTDDGDFSLPGSGGNLPAGETFISPEPGTGNGKIVFDGSLSLHDRDVIIKEPVCVDVAGGFAKKIYGGKEADQLRKTLESACEKAMEIKKTGKFSKKMCEAYAKNTYNIGEIGIGLNPEAGIGGNLLEDEKAYNTCHLAIGYNYDDVPALIHLDGLITKPSIFIICKNGQKKELMREGEILF